VGANFEIVNIYWTDHLGHSGAAQWNAAQSASSGSVSFTAEVPVQPAVNRITIMAVDSRNQSGAAQLAVYSDASGGPAPSVIGTGFWNAMPVTYPIIDGQAVVDGDIVLGTAANWPLPNRHIPA
jgi:hypothetical protein